MGYTTDFEGRFDLDRQLAPEHAAYLKAFSESRRMARDMNVTDTLADDVRHAAGLHVGIGGGYFVGGSGFMGQGGDPGIINRNSPPEGQPGLWCHWAPSDDGRAIEWEGSEKFYHYEEWLNYIIDHFLGPWGYVLNGKVIYQGEDPDDFGTITVVGNVVTRNYGAKE